MVGASSGHDFTGSLADVFRQAKFDRGAELAEEMAQACSRSLSEGQTTTTSISLKSSRQINTFK
jgi:hypothetical protein